jgi:hypothetical protein
MRRPALLALAALCAASVISTAGAAGPGWHVTPVRLFGKRIGSVQVAAVSPSGTTVVVLASHKSLNLVRRAVGASVFKVSGRVSAPAPLVFGFTALADGRFLLVYGARGQLVARNVDQTGRFAGAPHVLASEFPPGWPRSGVIGNTMPIVAVDSDASRAVVVWGAFDGATGEVDGAVDGQAGWSSAQVFVQGPAETLFIPQLTHDAQDHFLVSVHGANGDMTSALWGLAPGSQQWEPVTAPQSYSGSKIASFNGATLASLNGMITAAWQDASAALVVSTWDGTTWTSPITAIPGGHTPNGVPVTIYPIFVSDGSRAAIVWSDESQGLLGPVKATIRADATASWSAPVVFPHARGTIPEYPAPPQDAFWFTPSGGLAGVWRGGPLKGSVGGGGNLVGLYAGQVGLGGFSSTAISLHQHPNNGRNWFALPNSTGPHTVVWSDRKGHEFTTVVTASGGVRPKRPLPTCGYPWTAASNADGSARILVVTRYGPQCPAVFLW